MVTCVNYGALAAGSGCATPGFCPPEYRAWLLTGPLIPSRPSRPTDPHISPRRAAAQTAPTAAIIMGLRGKKSSHRGHGDARMPARFFRFPPGPSIYLAACKEQKKKRKGMRLFMLCVRWPGKHSAARSILLLKEGFF